MPDDDAAFRAEQRALGLLSSSDEEEEEDGQKEVVAEEDGQQEVGAEEEQEDDDEAQQDAAAEAEAEAETVEAEVGAEEEEEDLLLATVRTAFTHPLRCPWRNLLSRRAFVWVLTAIVGGPVQLEAMIAGSDAAQPPSPLRLPGKPVCRPARW
jgi:hypothetical protein